MPWIPASSRRPEDEDCRHDDERHPIVTINKAGELYLGKNPVNINDLVSEIHTRYPGQNAVYIKADKETTMEIAVA